MAPESADLNRREGRALETVVCRSVFGVGLVQQKDLIRHDGQRASTVKCSCAFLVPYRSVAPQDMRYRCPCSLVILLFQICDHAWCKKKRCADEHFHTECEKECPGRVVCVQGTTSKASSEICKDEEYASVSRVIVS